MCGIVGIYLKSKKFEKSLGGMLSKMLVSMESRGPDSAGFAIYKSDKNKIVAVASSSHLDQKTKDWLVKNNIARTVSIGSSLKFCLVASGEADVYPRFGPTMEWDTAAGDAVLRYAGGRVEYLDGSKFTYGKKNFKNTPFTSLTRCIFFFFRYLLYTKSY